MIPGINEIQSLATKYSKAQLAHMAQMGTVDPTKAVMAGMMIDRIEQQNMQVPKTTVAQDVMAPPAPQAPQMGMPPQAPQGQPQQAAPAGVSGIPAPNMEKMAGGGIVAFDDGGVVYDPVSGMPISGDSYASRSELADFSPAELAARAVDPNFQPFRAPVRPTIAAAPTAKPTTFTQPPVAAAPAVPPTAKPPAAPRQMGPTSASTGIGSLSQTMKEVGKASGMDALKAQYEGLPAEAEAANVREKTLAEQRPEYVPYEKYEKSLTKEAADAEGKKSENVKMALINAGLAMMGGKSQYALQNIAEGAQVGTKQYAEGMKELDKAAKEREKALAEIEQARNLYGEKKYDRAEALEKSANDRLMTAREKAVAGVSGITGKTLEASTAIVNTHEHVVAQERIANIQAGIQRESNEMYHKGMLDQTQAKTLIDASDKFLAANKDKTEYIKDPAKLQADAINYAKQVARTFMPQAGGVPTAPAGPRKQPLSAFGG